MTRESVCGWIEARRDLWLDALRIYMGVALFVKGAVFVSHSGALLETMTGARVPFAGAALAQYVALAHIAGGFLLAIGLVTRLAAAVQIPIVAGAVLFVHRKEGLFLPSQTLEFALLVLFLLVLFTVNGSGRLSVDHYSLPSRYAGTPEPLGPTS